TKIRVAQAASLWVSAACRNGLAAGSAIHRLTNSERASMFPASCRKLQAGSLRYPAFWLSLLLCATVAGAQDTPTPTPVLRAPVPIRFVPPPLEGAISLGVYDANGKLVRVLQREATLDEFEAGADALSTTWDGKDDQGQPLPAGKYRARGYVVGEIEVEGVDYFFNDWVDDEQPRHIAKITAIAVENGVPLVTAELAGNEAITLACDNSGKIVTTGTPRPAEANCPNEKWPATVEPLSCAPGKDGTLWMVDRVAAGSTETEVKQFAPNHEVLRRLSIPAEEPQPRAIAASKDTETIFLLEENSAKQRLRCLSLLDQKTDQGQSISDWKVEFEKEIVAHKDFMIANGEPVLSGGAPPPENVSVVLMENPLEKNARTKVELAVGLDAKGSYLKTADGLPLESISETPHLTRIIFAPDSENSLDVFQDDGAVVEQFHLDALEKMMAFDCGEIELK
ncbi:MAG: FlgD immunoglobulin-like domain containing protein, partial [Chthoniobacterales bacterium]